MQAALHAKGNYGTASLSFGKLVSKVVNDMDAKTLLDYGCGSMCNLAKVLEPDHDLEYAGYDPAVPEYASLAEPAELVVCIDVLEHIEPEFLDAVLDDLKRCTLKAGFFSIHTGPAVKVLPDGRNAHLIQQPPKWWLEKLFQRFEVATMQKTNNGFWVVVYVD
jgi:hypothetical protein